MSGPVWGIEDGQAPVAAVPIGANWKEFALPIYPPQSAWSHSAVKQHESCPRVIRYRRIDRIEEPKGPHLARGISVHKAIQSYIEGESHLMPEFLDLSWYPLINGMREGGYKAEHEIAIDKDWHPVEWFAKNVWGRVAFDVFHHVGSVAELWDWKTGKRYLDSELDQAKLYALSVYMTMPQIDVVSVAFGHVDRPKPLTLPTYAFSRQGLHELQEWHAEWIRAFFADTLYPAKPSWKCNYCHFRRTNQGPCEHG